MSACGYVNLDVTLPFIHICPTPASKQYPVYLIAVVEVAAWIIDVPISNIPWKQHNISDKIYKSRLQLIFYSNKVQAM